jgi:thioredoxin-related protein
MLKLHRPLAALAASLCLAAAPVFAAAEGWTEDYAAAKSQAEEQGKDLMLEFTGSDWCPPCKRLNEAVFSHDEFAKGAGKHFVLVKLDFPRSKPQSDELKAQNRSLQQQYAIRGYPTVMLTDALGRPYAKTGFRPVGPEEYVAHLAELKQVRVTRDEHMDKAKDAEGLDKAKHLHAAMQAVGDDFATEHYGAVVEQIMTLDADNEAGLKSHYETIMVEKQQRQTLQKAMRTAQGDPAGTIATLDDLAAADDTLTPIKQEALALKSRIQLILLKDKPAAKATLMQAIEIDADSDMGKMLKQALERTFSDDA